MTYLHEAAYFSLHCAMRTRILASSLISKAISRMFVFSQMFVVGRLASVVHNSDKCSDEEVCFAAVDPGIQTALY